VELGDSLQGEEGDFQLGGVLHLRVNDPGEDVDEESLFGQGEGVGCDPLAGEELASHPVGKQVNSPAFDAPACIEPA